MFRELEEIRSQEAGVRRQEAGIRSQEKNKPRPVHIAESHQVVVTCDGEQDQHALYDRLTAEGYECRLLML